jgi:2-polyprenyl-3-methyl-5-hydroxy-6-metoxy-1,4-benzoquinol methylase
MLEVRSIGGLHDVVVDYARRHVNAAARALDLGAWSGALAERLKNSGFQVVAGDIQNDAFRASVDFLRLDLNEPDFHKRVSGEFDLVTCVEVIEHVESPIALLRNIRQLLRIGGLAIVTTPNVQNVAARLNFLTAGTIRSMDEKSTEHITPVFYDLFVRQYLPRAELSLVEYFVHPEGGYPLTARRYFVPMFKTVGWFLRGRTLSGDSIIFVLRRER